MAGSALSWLPYIMTNKGYPVHPLEAIKILYDGTAIRVGALHYYSLPEYK
jgi:hypothetical protein